MARDGVGWRLLDVVAGQQPPLPFYPTRSMIESEVDAIWKSQRRWHSDLLTDEPLRKIKHILVDQRPLKPQVPGRCTLFSEDERAPKAHPFFQRFRIFQDVGSLRVREGLSERPLRLDERDHVVLALASCVGVRVLVGSFPSRGFGQVDIHLDQLITSGPSGARSHGGSSQEDRPLQSMYEGLYFPIAAELEAYLVPSGDGEVRLEIDCEWIDFTSARVWQPTSAE